MEFVIENDVLVKCIVAEDEEDIIIPEGVKSIDSAAIKECKWVRSVVIPEGVTVIERSTFLFMHALTSISLPKSLREIHKFAFRSCTKLEHIELPDGITVMEDYAFGGCVKLKEIKLPDSLTHLPPHALYDCRKLKKVILPNGLKSIGERAISFCNIEEIELPEGLERIEKMAFSSSYELRSVSLPQSVTYIGEEAFSFCEKLDTVAFPDRDDLVINADVFHNTPWLDNHPDDLVYAGKTLCHYKGDAAHVVIPEGTSCISPNTFQKDLTLTSIVIPPSVKSIGEYAFADCHNLKTATIAAHSINYAAFFNCIGLEKLILEDTVTDISKHGFSNCYSVSEVVYKHEGSSVPLVCSAGLKAIIAPKVHLSAFDNDELPDEEYNDHLYYFRRAATGYMMTKYKCECYDPDIEKEYEQALRLHTDKFSKHIPVFESVAAYFCQHRLIAQESLDSLIDAAKNNTNITAMLLQYKHENFSSDNEEYHM